MHHIGHLMPNTFYTYIKYIVSKHTLGITSLNKPELIFLPTVKWFHLISNNLILHKYSVFGVHTVKCKNSPIHSI